jgi:2-methylcitrate dehydratase PrpD
MNDLEKLAAFVSDFSLNRVNPSVISAAKRHVIDNMGCIIGGHHASMVESIEKVMMSFETTRENKIYVIGGEKPTNLRLAVFLNAMQGHVLEMDDVHIKSKTHIGTIVVATAWTLCNYLGKSGRDFLEAVICGYEVMARIGMGFGVTSHRNRGWHVTSTAGTFGAAAVCAKLFGFNTERITAAFGMAGTQSFGTWAFLSDGATNKILHPGRAAASGFDACLLVKGGMRGSKNILDAADGGIFPMMSDEYDYSKVSKGLGEEYELMNVDTKPYPCCRSTHASIDAAIYLKETYQIDPGEINSILVKTYDVGYKQCACSDSSRHPVLPTHAKFSTAYTVATALLKNHVTIDDFSAEAIQNEEVQQLLSCVTVKSDEQFSKKYPDHWGCNLEIHMNDGTIYEKEIEDASGSVNSPLNELQMMNKLKDCCQGVDPKWLQHILNSIDDMENLAELPDLSNP